MQQQETTHKFEYCKLEDGILKYKHRVYIPNLENIKKLVLKEMHDVPHVGHYDYQKIVTTTKRDY